MRSEKARIPAWTDRILRKGTNLRQITYNSAALRFSDHRPVYATFECTVSIVDESVREALSRQIYEKRRSEIGGIVANSRIEDSDDEDLIGYEPIEPGLPPASSDQRKWWLDNGKPAKSKIKPPQAGALPNPARKSNPYTPTDESDWVTVPRMSTARTNSLGRISSKAIVPLTVNATAKPKQLIQSTRKLPPPFDPSAQLANKSEELTGKSSQAAGLPQTGTPEPRSRSSSTFSTASRKAAPPVAKKPSHLTISAAGGATAPLPQSLPRKPSTDRSLLPPPPRRASNPVIRKELEPPPLPQPRRGGKKPQIEDEGPKPMLPARPTDLLGDDVEGMNGWEALKPVR